MTYPKAILNFTLSNNFCDNFIFTWLLPFPLQDPHSGDVTVWFVFQKIRYMFTGVEFEAVKFNLSDPLQKYLNHQGFQSDEEVEVLKKKYGLNRYGGWIE